jgi:hypothetical protein
MHREKCRSVDLTLSSVVPNRRRVLADRQVEQNPITLPVQVELGHQNFDEVGLDGV